MRHHGDVNPEETMPISISPVPPAYVHAAPAALPPIPAFKRDEKERRGAGATGSFLGRATGIILEAGPAAPGSGFNSLLWGLNGRGGLLALVRVFFARFFSAGELALLSVGILSAAALTVFGLTRLLYEGANKPAAPMVWQSEGPSNGLSSAGSRSGEDLRPSVGELVRLEDDAKAAAAPAARPALEDAPKAVGAEPPPAAADPAGSEVQAAPAPRAVVAKLIASSLGSAAASRFNGERLRDSLAAMNGPKTFGNLPPMRDLSRQAPSALTRAHRLLGTRLTGQLGARSTRAMGQLRITDRASRAAAASASAESGRQCAASAFEQSSALSEAGPVGGAGVSAGQAVPLGTGAPDVTAPSVGPGENKTPYQKKVDEAKKGIDMAKMLTILGIVLLAVGAAMLVAAEVMLASDPSEATKALALQLKDWGIKLLIAGALALAAGLVMKRMAQDKAKDVADQSGKQDQGRVINACADQAVAPMSCNPPAVDQPANGVHAAVEAEGKPSFGMGAAAPTPAAGGPIAAGRAG